MRDHGRIGRREFFTETGYMLAATATSLGGLDAHPVGASPGTNISGRDSGRKILVAYATRAGSTAEVAGAIGQALRVHGVEVDVLPAQEVNDLKDYRALIVGSAIRMGRWLPDAAGFVDRNHAALGRMPTAFFTVCMTMQKDTPESRRAVEAYMQPVLEKFRPARLGLFGGKMDYSRLGFLDRLIVSKMKKVPEGDHRDWTAIRAWSEGFRS
jgi:menaquinone-dependent protoporphyrinogen oxidase